MGLGCTALLGIPSPDLLAVQPASQVPNSTMTTWKQDNEPSWFWEWMEDDTGKTPDEVIRMKTELDLLGSRTSLAVTLRRGGMTYREVGEKIGVGGKRASQIVARGERILGLIERGVEEVELNCRAANCLSYHGINSSRKSVKEAIESGVLNLQLRNYGRKTHKICCEYAGIPHHVEYERINRLRAEIKRLEKPIEELGKVIKRLQEVPA